MSYTVSVSTSVVLVPTSSNYTRPYVVSLPNISTVGRLITIRDNDGLASLSNSILISTQSGVSFADGTTSISINQPYGFITLNSQGNTLGVSGNIVPTYTYTLLNTFAFPATQSAASINTVTANTLQLVNRATQNIDIIYSSNTQLYLNNTTVGQITDLNLTSTVTGLGSIGYLSSLNTIGTFDPIWVSVGRGPNYNTSTAGSIRYSYDRLNWSSSTSGFLGECQGVIYGNGIFVAVGQNAPSGGSNTGFMQWSLDGINWNYSSGPSLGNNQYRTGCLYANGLFHAIGSSSANTSGTQQSKYCILWSQDGKSWNPATSNFTNVINTPVARGIAYGNGVWVCTLDTTTNGATNQTALWSSDGSNWNPANTVCWTGSNVSDVSFDGTKFICLPNFGTGGKNIAVSTDGKNWSNTNITGSILNNTQSRITSIPNLYSPPSAPPGSPVVASILTCGNGSTVGNQVFYSIDGFNWAKTTSFSNIYTIFLGKPYYDGQFWWMGFDNSNTVQQKVVYSSDGINWTSSNLTGLFFGASNQAFQFVAVGGTSNFNLNLISTVTQFQNSFITSTIQVGTLGSGAILSPTYIRGASISSMIVAVGGGYDNSIQYSIDGGFNWTSANANFVYGGYGIGYNGSSWIATGETASSDRSASVLTSVDGINWNQTINGRLYFGTIHSGGVAANSQQFVIAASSQGFSPIGSIITSADGFTWSNNITGGFLYGNSVAWNGSYWLAVGGNVTTANSIQRSTDGRNWSSSVSRGGFSGTFGGYGLGWNGSYWVAVGNDTGSNTIQKSTDGSNWYSASTGGFLTEGYRVAWNGSYWVAVGAGSVLNTIQRSTDGANWVSAAVGGFSSYGSGIIWNGSNWIAVGKDATQLKYIQTSEDGFVWRPVQRQLNNGTLGVLNIANTYNIKSDIQSDNINFYLTNTPYNLTGPNDLQRHNFIASISTLSMDSTVFIQNNTKRVGINIPAPTCALDIMGDVNINGNLLNITNILSTSISYVNFSSIGSISSINISTGALYVSSGIIATLQSISTICSSILTSNITTSQLVMTGSSVRIGFDAGSQFGGNYNVAIGNGAATLAQSDGSVAIGFEAAQQFQNTECVAIGNGAARFNQAGRSVAIGYKAGRALQSTNSVAIGNQAGSEYQGSNSVTIGFSAGFLNQASGSVAIGYNAGYSNQRAKSLALGYEAGYFNQGNNTVALGYTAGYSNQRANSVALGYEAGYSGQLSNSLALGYQTGYLNQGNNSIALGYQTGYLNQGNNSLAMGIQAGYTNQSSNSIAIGNEAGQRNQLSNSVAVGYQAGQSNQGSYSVAVGYQAGQSNQDGFSVGVGLWAGKERQGLAAVAVGNGAGKQNQANFSVALGVNAGWSNQGIGSVAIGCAAGFTNQHPNTIIVNATTDNLPSQQPNTFIVKPVRNKTTEPGFYPMVYNPTTGEIAYQL
jgi:hypothetical protein